MEKSLFIQFVTKYFVPVIAKIVDRIRGENGDNPQYLFMSMLRKQYSLTMKWETIIGEGRIVSADVVSMDSPLPLKRREKLRGVEGSIPKLGTSRKLGEEEMSRLRIMEGLNQDGSQTKQMVKTIFEDAKNGVLGVFMKLEWMFLEALSTGMATIGEEENTGVAVRLDYGHPDENKYGVQAEWSDPENSTPWDDIENVMDAADEKGVTIQYLFMDNKTFGDFAKSKQVRRNVANAQGMVITDTDNIAKPNLNQVNEALDGTWPGLTIVKVNTTITYEKNGERTRVRPFAQNTVAFLPSLEVGKLFWSILAEDWKRAKQVDYTKVEDYILVSKYHSTNPYGEFTDVQALAVPVIDNIDEIYFLSTVSSEDGGTTGITDEQTEGDDVFDYKGEEYTKDSVVAAINLAKPGTGAKSTWKDATLLAKINEFNAEEIQIFEDNIVPSGEGNE